MHGAQSLIPTLLAAEKGLSRCSLISHFMFPSVNLRTTAMQLHSVD
jgi:hypothetical protein